MGTKAESIISSVTSRFSTGQVGPYGVGETTVDIDAGEMTYNIHELRKEVMEFCEYLFETYDIP